MVIIFHNVTVFTIFSLKNMQQAFFKNITFLLTPIF